MKLKLVVLAGAKEGLEIPLKKEKFLIGRAKECALRAGSEAISRQHCAITRHDNRYTVKDLGSRNGTYVNDKHHRRGAAHSRERAACGPTQVSNRRDSGKERESSGARHSSAAI